MTTAPSPPAIVQPAPYEVSYGLVMGWVAGGTTRLIVRAGSRVLADAPLRGRHFTVRVDLPPREVTVRVTSVGRRGARSTRAVAHVLGLPRAASPVARTTHQDLICCTSSLTSPTAASSIARSAAWAASKCCTRPVGSRRLATTTGSSSGAAACSSSP